MSEQHEYPSNYPPDHPHWAVRLSWAIIDEIPPGAISNEKRFLLGGTVVGALMAAHQFGCSDRDLNKHPLLRDRPARRKDDHASP